MRQQVADRSPQRHATLPTYYKVRHFSSLNQMLSMSKTCHNPASKRHAPYTNSKYHLKVLLCTTKYYSSTTLYYTVLLQYYSVLQSNTPVLLCTTKYYSVLHSTTPVLLCTTQYYSSTALTYKVILQYYSVLQSTTLYYTVLLQYYSVLHSTTLYYTVLLCTTQYYSVLHSTTLYYTVPLQYYSALQSTTLYYKVLLQYYSSTTLYYASTSLYYKVLLQYYSVLHSTTPVLLQYYSVLQSTTLMIDPRHLWNFIYIARNNRGASPTSPNAAPATQNDSHDWSASHMKRYLHSKFHRILRLPQQVTLQLHQILRLPRKMNLMIDPCHKWNVIYNAQSITCHCPTSPNTAPATKNESHDWSLSQMKRSLQCAEQHVSLSRLTKYCACHEKWPSKISKKFAENSWNVISNARPIRPWSENETVRPQPASQPRLPFTPTTGILYWKIQHFALRLSFQISPNTAPATKSDTWTSPNTAPATKNNTQHWSSSHMKRYFQCAE